MRARREYTAGAGSDLNLFVILILSVFGAAAVVIGTAQFTCRRFLER